LERIDKLVLVTGGFDPLHSGHIDYFKSAKQLGDKLIVGLNSDEWLTRKKGRPFMPFKERVAIIKELSMVDDIIAFDDADDTSCGAIYKTMATRTYNTLIFANGGDRQQGNVPEESIYGDKAQFVYGVGGTNKKNSSSWILEDWKAPKTRRVWGWYRVLDDNIGYKVKELVIAPNSSLSMQRHFYRAEHWYVLKGHCALRTEGVAGVQKVKLSSNQTYSIDAEVWHQAINETNKDCHILEVQYGSKCIEDDIERKYGGSYTTEEIVEATKNILDNK